MVAAIAARELRPQVRNRIDILLQTGGDARTRDLYGAACWADDTKNRRTGHWHYIDLYFRSDGRPTLLKPEAENVDWAIAKFSKVLADKSASTADRAQALRYLIHFVGDAHQPLHAASRETHDMPAGDAGGNRVEIQAVKGIHMRRPSLHLLWDFGCGLFRDVDRPLGEATKAEIERMADRILKDYPVSSLPHKNDLSPADWSREGFEISKSFVYSFGPSGEISDTYLAKGKNICELRLAQAGHRLALLLNHLLG